MNLRGGYLLERKSVKMSKFGSNFFLLSRKQIWFRSQKTSFAKRWLHSLYPGSEGKELCLTLASSPLMELVQLLTLFHKA